VTRNQEEAFKGEEYLANRYFTKKRSEAIEKTSRLAG